MRNITITSSSNFASDDTLPKLYGCVRTYGWTQVSGTNIYFKAFGINPLKVKQTGIWMLILLLYRGRKQIHLQLIIGIGRKVAIRHLLI